MQTHRLLVGILLVSFLGSPLFGQAAYHGQKLYPTRHSPRTPEDATEQFALEIHKHSEIPRTLLRSLDHPVMVEFASMYAGLKVKFYPSSSLNREEINKLTTEAMKRMPFCGMPDNAELVAEFAATCWEKPTKDGLVYDHIPCEPYSFTVTMFHGNEHEPPFVSITRNLPKLDYHEVLKSLMKKGKGLPIAARKLALDASPLEDSILPKNETEALWMIAIGDMKFHQSRFRSTPNLIPVMVETDLAISPFQESKLTFSASAKQMQILDARTDLWDKLCDIRWAPIDDSKNEFLKRKDDQGTIKDATSEIRYKIAPQGDLLIGELFFKTLSFKQVPKSKKP